MIRRLVAALILAALMLAGCAQPAQVVTIVVTATPPPAPTSTVAPTQPPMTPALRYANAGREILREVTTAVGLIDRAGPSSAPDVSKRLLNAIVAMEQFEKEGSAWPATQALWKQSGVGYYNVYSRVGTAMDRGGLPDGSWRQWARDGDFYAKQWLDATESAVKAGQ